MTTGTAIAAGSRWRAMTPPVVSRLATRMRPASARAHSSPTDSMKRPNAVGSAIGR